MLIGVEPGSFSVVFVERSGGVCLESCELRRGQKGRKDFHFCSSPLRSRQLPSRRLGGGSSHRPNSGADAAASLTFWTGSRPVDVV